MTSNIGKFKKLAKKPEPSNKNKKKIDETLHSSIEDPKKFNKKLETLEASKSNIRVPYTKDIINRAGKLLCYYILCSFTEYKQHRECDYCPKTAIS